MCWETLSNDIENYLKFNHPHQIKIRNVFEKFSETKIKPDNYGIDGCSAPQYSFRMREISKLLINLNNSYKNKKALAFKISQGLFLDLYSLCISSQLFIALHS